MRKRPWLIWLIIVILFTLIGTAIWFKLKVDDAPKTHHDPGAPVVEGLPDPEDVE